MRSDQIDDGLAELLGLSRDDERRDSDRIEIHRRCTVHEPRSRRTVRGRTANVSRGGALLQLDGRVLVEAGDRVFVGIGDGARRRQEPELIGAEVIRVVRREFDHTVLAVRTDRTAASICGVIRGAA
jgi:hypothetical protein